MNSGSMPIEIGSKCRIVNSDEIFTVIDFDGSVYRLRSKNGIELRAGRNAVKLVTEAVLE